MDKLFPLNRHKHSIQLIPMETTFLLSTSLTTNAHLFLRYLKISPWILAVVPRDLSTLLAVDEEVAVVEHSVVVFMTFTLFCVMLEIELKIELDTIKAIL